MRKIIAPITGLISYLLLANPAFAVDLAICQEKEKNDILRQICLITPTDFGPMVGRVIIAVIIIAIIIAVFFLIIGGIRWITSGGDKSKVEGARNQIVAAIVGLIIAILAYFIISFVAQLFGINITNLTIPPLIGS
ncbi:MAG: hypothetical protein M1268_04150 [Patescibacteria group bacterium]|nr:hypothetical protein [Patescibacteria group bacterium]